MTPENNIVEFRIDDLTPQQQAEVNRFSSGSNYDPGLPGELGEVAQTIARMSGAHKSTVSLQVLAIAASALQGHFDAMPWWGQPTPLSIYTFIAAGSSQRKSASQRLVVKGPREWDSQERVRFKSELLEYKRQVAAAKKDGLDFNEPEPILDRRLFGDTTLQKATSIMAGASGVALWYTDEVAKVVGGFNMTSENVMKTCGDLNNLWDGSPQIIDRVGAGEVFIESPRLTLSFAGQIEPSRTLFGNGTAENTGLLSRMLFVQPPSILTEYHDYEPTDQDWAIVLKFKDWVKEMMGKPLPMLDGVRNPIILDTTLEAKKLVKAYHAKLHYAQLSGGRYEDFNPAGKSHEQAYRIAGCLAAYRGATEIDRQDMSAAIDLAQFYLEQAYKFMAVASSSQISRDADLMHAHLIAALDGKSEITGRAFQREWKTPFRGQPKRAREALQELVKSGIIERIDGPKRSIIWRLSNS